MKNNATLIDKIRPTAFLFVSATVVLGVLLASSCVSADDSVIDQINITVPVSCTISGTGMNTHNANINNGLYEDDIGSTTLHAFCNDNEGFAIYAAGYTGNEVGGENSNKLVGTTASGNAVIESGLAITAGNPDVSNWAMKLAIAQDSGDTTGTNAFAIDNSFNAYHIVPNEYTKVAHKNSATDMTESTGGVKLTTTYAAYISKTQAADTYSGQVIYTLVHPYNAVKPTLCNPAASTIDEAVCLQDFATGDVESIKTSMVPEVQYSLRDKRDGKMYTIAKYQVIDDAGFYNSFEDFLRSCKSSCSIPPKWMAYYQSCGSSVSSCDESLIPKTYSVWMTQNLDLSLDADTTYTNEDTDIGYNVATNTYDDAHWKPMRSTYNRSLSQMHEWCVGGMIDDNNVCADNYTPESYDPGDVYMMTDDEEYGPEMQEYIYYYNLIGDYVSSCENGSCDESLYQQLNDDWRRFADTCDSSFLMCDYALLPVAPDHYIDQTLRSELYIGLCHYNDACDESVYNMLDDDWQQYVDSCMVENEGCNNALRPIDNKQYGQEMNNLAYRYMDSCRTAECDEEFYDVLDDDWKTYVDSCSYVNYERNCDDELMPPSFGIGGIPQYHVGNYYNWAAAVASNDISNYRLEYVGGMLTEQSICPAGWTLPRTDTDYSNINLEFEDLWNSYGFEQGEYPYSALNSGFTIWQKPLYFVMSGYYDGRIRSYTRSAYYWSANTLYVNWNNKTVASGASYTTESESHGVNLRDYLDRGLGRSIRCVARPVGTFPPYMIAYPDFPIGI